MNKLRWLTVAVIMMLFLAQSVVSADDTACDTDCGEVTSGVPNAIIMAYPEPDVQPLTYNHDLSQDRSYYQVDGTVNVYDAPNGNVLFTLDAGFNFVTVQSRVDGWVEIKSGQWMKSEDVAYANNGVTQFTGVFLPEEGLPYTMAWMLVNRYPSKVPGGDPVESNGLLYRYTRVYIYATVEREDGRWYQIGIDKWVHQFNVAKVQPIERPADVTTEKWVGIDLYEQVMIAYEGDRAVFTTLIATGLPRWPTYEGTFNIYYRMTRDDMTWGTPGDDYYFLEEVPWTMYFDEGRALHGAYWHDGFGYRRSHGCVNLPITDANWLYEWVADDMGSFASADREEGPNVHVYSTDEYSQ